MAKRTCTVCGNASTGEHCFRHKPKKAIRRTPLKKGRPKETKTKPEGKRRSVKLLKKLVWTVYSRVVRLEESDEYGIGKCVTCDNLVYWKYADTGHYIKRKHNMTFMHRKNTHFQCKTCNQYKDGMEKKHGEAIDLMYGEGAKEELQELSRQTKRWTPEELETLLEENKLRFAELIKTKKRYEHL